MDAREAVRRAATIHLMRRGYSAEAVQRLLDGESTGTTPLHGSGPAGMAPRTVRGNVVDPTANSNHDHRRQHDATPHAPRLAAEGPED